MTKLAKLKIALKESLNIMSISHLTKEQKNIELNKHYIIIDSIINIVGFETYLIILQNIERD